MIFILEAVGLGMFLKYTKFNKWINTAVAIVLLVAAIALGLHFPMYVGLDAWHLIIFVYILIASVAPVWALLQPRDYLNSYLLIFMIVGAIVGVFVANPSCNLQAFTSFNVDGQYMFPILFVTIACGAVSGFHSLVSSGTASKQIKNEKNMLPVSFGAMLMESMLAVIALIAVASFAKGEAAAQGLTTQPQMIGYETVVSDINISVVIINRRTVEWISYHLAPMLPSRIDAVVIIIISTRYMVCDTRCTVMIVRTTLIFGIEILQHHIFQPARILQIQFEAQHDVLQRIHEETPFYFLIPVSPIRIVRLKHHI